MFLFRIEVRRILHLGTGRGRVRVMSFEIRLLRPDQPGLYRRIRLESLRLHPESFGSSFEEESAQSLAWFRQRLTGNAIFGGFREKALLGCVGFMPESGLKRAHKGHLWGMYVREEARGTGLARELVEAVVTHARERVMVLQLSVTVGNLAARRLYEAAGFKVYGLEAAALHVDGRYVDEEHMAMRFG
jgi:RimJ/RimL family protein N-acetyltransferase